MLSARHTLRERPYTIPVYQWKIYTSINSAILKKVNTLTVDVKRFNDRFVNYTLRGLNLRV
jgi:viroplasmin and RNaseH domain-containing protein